MGIEGIFSLIQILIVLIIVIIFANYVLKYLNKYMVGRNKIVKIVERVAVNKNSYISIVKICRKYYLMSFNENRNEILKELDVKEINDLVEEFEDEGRDYFEMGKTLAKKISNYNNNNNTSDNINSTDNIS
jgi:flagellar protein FliO/FliZ